MICERAAVYRKEEVALQSSRDLSTFYRAKRDAGNSRHAKSTAWVEIDAEREYVSRAYPAEMLTPYDVENNALFYRVRHTEMVRWQPHHSISCSVRAYAG